MDLLFNKKNDYLLKDSIKETDFVKRYSFEQRVKHVDRLHLRYPSRIPVIMLPIDNKQPKIQKTKYLVPDALTMSEFVFIIKKYIQISKEDALFIFTESGTILAGSTLMAEIYKQYMDQDKFLYLFYSLENTFG
jgi:hypothetical protein